MGAWRCGSRRAGTRSSSPSATTEPASRPTTCPGSSNGSTKATGEAALELLTRDVPTVIVSDIGLAGIDGFSLMRRIRALRSRARDVPAIALTAYARAEDRATALGAGYQLYLTKPVEPTELRA